MTKFHEICYDMTVLTIYVIVHGVCLHTNAPALINLFFQPIPYPMLKFGEVVRKTWSIILQVMQTIEFETMFD